MGIRAPTAKTASPRGIRRVPDGPPARGRPLSVADDARALVARTAVRQGLPERLTDPVTLAKVAMILRPEMVRQGTPPASRLRSVAPARHNVVDLAHRRRLKTP